jgi:hypothetical protein
MTAAMHFFSRYFAADCHIARMKTFAPILAVGLILNAPLRAEVTPFAQPITDATETVISCELTQAPPYTQVPVFESPKDSEKAKGTYHYKLWLPASYAAEPQKRWPCIFIMSPSGNISMGNMTAYLKANGYVVVMLLDAKNGDWSPIVGNFLAAHDDVTKRIRIDETRKYATGQSGGARASSVFVQLRPGFCGLILQSAGASQDDHGSYNITGIKRNPRLRIAMTMGTSDNNKPEVARMASLFNPQHFASFDFNGGHTWAPADVFEKAMTWINEKAAAAAPAGGTGNTGTGSSFDDFFKKK